MICEDCIYKDICFDERNRRHFPEECFLGNDKDFLKIENIKGKRND